MNTLLNRNVTVNGRRTSMRLEQEMWDALQEICRREGMTVHEVCSMIDDRRGASSLTASTRVFILMYFRTAAAVQPQPTVGSTQGLARQLIDRFQQSNTSINDVAGRA